MEKDSDGSESFSVSSEEFFNAENIENMQKDHIRWPSMKDKHITEQAK